MAVSCVRVCETRHAIGLGCVNLQVPIYESRAPHRRLIVLLFCQNKLNRHLPDLCDSYLSDEANIVISRRHRALASEGAWYTVETQTWDYCESRAALVWILYCVCRAACRGPYLHFFKCNVLVSDAVCVWIRRGSRIWPDVTGL